MTAVDSNPLIAVRDALVEASNALNDVPDGSNANEALRKRVDAFIDAAIGSLGEWMEREERG